MVYFEKSQPEPSSLANEKVKKSGTYRTSDVIERISKDFCDKCYICEQKKPTSINVEHFTPHKDDNNLKFDWNNLFYSCGHCNNVKLAKEEFDDILNCTIKTDDVDTAIIYRFNPFPKEKPTFEINISSPKVNNTITLLDKVFNGEHTSLKKLESINLNDLLLKSIKEFQEILLCYYDYDKDESYLTKIKFHLNKSSSFTAFKRHIIRSNNDLNNEFGQYIIN